MPKPKAKQPVNPQNQARLHIGAVPAGVQVAWKFIWCSGYDWLCHACADPKTGAPRRFRKNSPLLDVPPKQYTCKYCGGSCELRFHHFDPAFTFGGACGCPPGPHAQVLTTTAIEIAAAGGRGSGKTEDGFPLIIRGNYEEYQAAINAGKTPQLVDVTYLAHPSYRFLVIRKNSKDLEDFWRRAKAFFRLQPVRFEAKEGDHILDFETGAQGIFDHMANEDAYEKYQGQEFQTMDFEELTQIPSEERYIKITLSCRSSFPELKKKIFATANPGGPGAGWFRDRFVDIAPRGQIYTDPNGLTRIFIHSTILDNPYTLANDPVYVNQLRSIQDESLRKRWFLGDFDCLDGQFFTEFRDKAVPGEIEKHPAALHVIQPFTLLPHWRRWVSMDWGFKHNAAVLWHCRAADGRIYTYREKAESRVGSREWGVLIARESITDLGGLEDAHMVLYLSPDAFAKDDEIGSPAEQIASGIGQVLGKGAAFVMDLTDDERLMPTDQAWESVKRRRNALQSRTHITIQKASTQRIMGWAEMRDLLRWWPLITGNNEIDPQIANELLRTKGVTAYYEYLKQVESFKDEVLPKWRIFGPQRGPDGQPTAGTGCPKLIKGLVALQHKPDTEDVLDQKQDAQDISDAARYGLFRINEQPTSIPKPLQIAQAVEALGSGASGHSKYMTAVAMEQKLNQHAAGRAVFIPRRTGRHHRVAAGVR